MIIDYKRVPQAAGMGTYRADIMASKNWIFYPEDRARIDAIIGKLRLSEIVARILVNRGIHQPDEAQAFLKPQLNDLADPGLMVDMDVAVARIHQAVRNREKILVYGDFDADGITGTSLLLHFFKLLNATTDYYIPNRITEGYSFTEEGIRAILDRDVNLVVSVDNGISSLKEVAELRSRGVDVIITDHHEPPDELPPANAVVDPKRKDCPYPFKKLSGVGVAFKLTWAVAQHLSRGKKVSPEFRRFLLNGLAWVALGTVADLVPLVGENRVFAKYGLPAIQNSPNPGLRALCDLISSSQRQALTAEDISFRIGPRINAAGRMGRVDVAMELFLTGSYQKAMQLATELDAMNRERQQVERGIFEDVEKRREALDQRIIITGDPLWHPGVIGVVASKLVEKYGKPSILLSFTDGMGRGSCRSVPGFDMHQALSHCSDLLETFGGHASAGGMKIRKERLPDFEKKMRAYLERSRAGISFGTELNIDCEVNLVALSHRLLSELEQLRPFGEGNPVPILATSKVQLARPAQQVGKNADHLSFYVRQGTNQLKAIAFSRGEDMERLNSVPSFTLAYSPRMNYFSGRSTIELEIKDILYT